MEAHAKKRLKYFVVAFLKLHVVGKMHDGKNLMVNISSGSIYSVSQKLPIC